MFEFATAIGPHREKIHAIVASGDLHQGSPDVNRTGQNEFEKAGEVSFMDSMVNDSAQRFETCQLAVQYRMHPDIARPNSQIWYPGQGKDTSYVIDGPWSATNPVMDERMSWVFGQLLAEFGHRGNRIMCLNVDGRSGKYNRSGSFSTWTRRAAVWLVEQLDWYTRDNFWLNKPDNSHDNDGTADNPADDSRMTEDGQVDETLDETADMECPADEYPAHTLSLLTTYTGNERAMNAAIAARLYYNRKHLDVQRALTHKAAQGQEFDTTIVSMVKCEGTDVDNIMNLGWVSDSRVLNVLTSRARGHLVVIANFQAWIRVLLSDLDSPPGKVLARHDNRKFKRFLQYVFGQELIYDFNAVRARWENLAAEKEGIYDRLRQNFKSYVSGLPRFHGKGRGRQKASAVGVPVGRFGVNMGSLPKGAATRTLTRPDQTPGPKFKGGKGKQPTKDEPGVPEGDDGRP